jgi:SET domain-containing protein
MYKQYLKVQDCKAGKGLFTTVKIPANSLIMEISGPVVLDKDIKDNHSQYLQVGPNTFLGPSGDVDDFINHHCDPNCMIRAVGNRAQLYSLYVIPAGAELNFDYSTTSTDALDVWSMECKCGSNKCRKLISGHHYLNGELREKYLDKGMFPLYIMAPGMIKKK